MNPPEPPNVVKRTKRRLPSVGVLLVIALFVSCGGILFVYQMPRSGIRRISAVGGAMEVDVELNPVLELITDSLEIDEDVFATDGDVKEVKLSGSQVTDRSLQSLRHFRAVRRITIENSPVTDAGLDHLVSAKSVVSIRLRNLPNVTDRGLARLAQFPRLKYLTLSEMRITGSQISELSQIGFLGLRACPNVDDRVFERIGRMKSLWGLTLSRSPKITDAGLAKLAALPQFERLTLESMPITGSFLSRLTSLKQLHLDNCPHVSDATLEQIGGLANLGLLDIRDVSGSPVTDAGLEHLGGLERLGILRLDGLQITDESLQFISENFPGLHSLSLKNLSGITDEGVLKLRSLKSLEQQLWIQCPGISPEIEDKLSTALPNCSVKIL